LIIVDLPYHAIIDQGRLGKIARMADLNNVAVALITQQGEDNPFTLGSIISLRIAGEIIPAGDNACHCVLSSVKDKLDPPGWRYSEVFYVPDGLC
jgi:hypothetical protein